MQICHANGNSLNLNPSIDGALLQNNGVQLLVGPEAEQGLHQSQAVAVDGGRQRNAVVQLGIATLGRQDNRLDLRIWPDVDVEVPNGQIFSHGGQVALMYGVVEADLHLREFQLVC